MKTEHMFIKSPTGNPTDRWGQGPLAESLDFIIKERQQGHGKNRLVALGKSWSRAAGNILGLDSEGPGSLGEQRTAHREVLPAHRECTSIILHLGFGACWSLELPLGGPDGGLAVC